MLYFGDNLDILRTYVRDESADLIYLDPPFNSQAQYNVLFRTPQDRLDSAQAGAFRDMWAWGDEAEAALAEVMKIGGNTARLIDALRTALGTSDIMAYLVMMAVRLHELSRKLKPTGSLFLHCDPTASHYLKLLLDGILGPQLFKNEIIWQRSTGKSLMTRRLPTNHDVILFYGGPDSVWNSDTMVTKYDPENLPAKTAAKYSHTAPDGRLYQLDNLINPNQNRPNLTYEFMGVTRVWRWTRERMEKAAKDGLIVQTGPGRVPRLIRYLDEQKGIPLSDVWTDIPPLNSQAKERQGYPTQKPLALLDRIIRAASNEGGLVLDPFCGCGTTIEAAERAGRQWIGIDIAVHAIKVIESRMLARLSMRDIPVEGIPKDFDSAVRLAERDKYQFQWWANYLFNPHALREYEIKGVKKGADRGVDGELFFPNGPGRPWGRMLTSVKGGNSVTLSMVRDFRGVLEREGAEMGLFICLYPPTRAMRAEAASAGIARTVHGKIPRLQIVALQEWFAGAKPKQPPVEHLPSAAIAPSQKARAAAPRPDPKQPELPLPIVGGKSSEFRIHINPNMVDRDGERQLQLA